ncbi:MAG: hypothetical protein R2800_09085 [Flavipsychrobacter sp.]
MPSRFSLILVAILTIIVASCDFDKQEKAMQRSIEIAAINDSLAGQGKIWGDELLIAVNTLDFSNMKNAREELVGYVNKKIAKLKAMKPIAGSEELQKAELEFLEFELKMIDSHFVVFESFDENTSKEDMENAYLGILQYNEIEQEKLKHIYDLREDYAELNGFPKPIE